MLRTINNIIRTLLFHAHIPPTYWVEALHMAAHLLNILPSKAIKNETPTYRLFHTHPTYDHLRIFGCLCFPHITTSHKLSPRTTPCIFLGYPTHHRGFRCLDLSTRKIIISRHVTFDENTFPFQSVTPNNPPSYSFLDNIPDSPSIFRSTMFSPTVPPPNSVPPPQPDLTTSPTNPSSSSGSPLSDSTQPISGPSAPPPAHPMTTRSRSGIVKPLQRLNLHVSSISPVPRSHIQAIEDPN